MRYASITDRLAGLGGEKWRVHLAARAMAAAGEDVIELTIGEPDQVPAQDLLAACVSAIHGGRTRYAGGQGEPALLDALAERYTARTGRDITRDNVIALPGTQTGLFAVMLALVERGDTVLVGDPLYATYQAVIGAAGATARYVPLREEAGFRMAADDLSAAITPSCRVLLLNSPHNPTGAVLTGEDIEAIGAVCEAHDLWIVCDEVYEHLIFDGRFASPLDNARLAERAVALSSISKSHASPGFRSGWAVGPAELIRRLLPICEAMLFGNQPFIADMTVHALTQPNATAPELTATYKRRSALISRVLGNAAGLRPLAPQAGMFSLVDVSGTGLSSAVFAERLLREHKVAVMPGTSFGENAAPYVRLSLTVPDDTLAEAAERMAAFASDLADAMTHPSLASGRS